MCEGIGLQAEGELGIFDLGELIAHLANGYILSTETR